MGSQLASMTRARFTSLALFASLMAVAGCPAAEPAAKPAVAKNEAAPKTKADEPAAKTDAAPAKTDAAPAKAAEGDADEKGCIYVEGEQGGDPSCPHGAGAGHEGGEPQGPATGTGHFGAPFSKTDEPVALGQVLAAAEPPKDSVLIKGQVEAVCQKKGCWMVVKDGNESARVLMKDHSFAVPMDCRGKDVTVEGTLATRTFNEDQVKHLAKDGGGNPDEVSGERTEHVLTASGILIQS
jgi:hypothetical protein